MPDQVHFDVICLFVCSYLGIWYFLRSYLHTKYVLAKRLKTRPNGKLVGVFVKYENDIRVGFDQKVLRTRQAIFSFEN